MAGCEGGTEVASESHLCGESLGTGEGEGLGGRGSRKGPSLVFGGGGVGSSFLMFGSRRARPAHRGGEQEMEGRGGGVRGNAGGLGRQREEAWLARGRGCWVWTEHHVSALGRDVGGCTVSA